MAGEAEGQIADVSDIDLASVTRTLVVQPDVEADDRERFFGQVQALVEDRARREWPGEGAGGISIFVRTDYPRQAASALAGLAMPEAAGVTDYDTYVIGRFPDVAPWNDVPFTKVLNMVDWDPVANVEWVSEGIANGNTFTLASPLSQATIDAVYSSEVNQVIWDGAYTISPGQYLLLVP